MQHNDDIDNDWTQSELAVLRSAELDAPPHGSDERLLTALGIAAAATVATSATASSVLSSASGQTPLWLKGFGLLLVGGGVTGAVLVAQHQPTPGARAAVSMSAPAAAPAAALAAPAASAAVPAEPAAASTPAPPPATNTVASLPLAEPSEKRDGKAVLADEIRLIDEARAELRQGNAQAALGTLDRYDQTLRRSGSLRAEATVVRIEALQKSGAKARAASLAQRFLANNPSSPYADYVRRIVSE